MDIDSLTLAQWQFRVAWSLADEVQLPRLTDQMCWWLPVTTSWTVRKATDNEWHADWSEPEPVNPAAPTIGWLTWHLLWWCGDAGRSQRISAVGAFLDSLARICRLGGSAAACCVESLDRHRRRVVGRRPEPTDQLSLE